jgi:hypothetical protein
MNARERMDAAIHLRPVDRIPNTPFYEAPIFMKRLSVDI